MQPSPSTLLPLLVVFALQECAIAFALWGRGQCDVPSAYSELSKTSTGSAFCSSLLYPHGPSTSTIMVSATFTKPCKTVTETDTDTKSKTVVRTDTTVLPTTTIKEYTSTVLVPSGTHRPVDKRAAQNSTITALTSTSTQASTSTSTTASVSALAAPPASVSTTASTSPSAPVSDSASAALATPAGQQQKCDPTPSKLCTCAANTISAACSSLIQSPTPVTSTYTTTTTVKCPKDTITVTTTIKDKSTSTYTFTEYPPPSIIYKTKTLTTTVPAACASPAYQGSGGSNVIDTVYPYFPQTGVECCVLCYDPAFPNCVASAFIEGSLTCELLIRDNSTAGTSPSKQCPLGVENYDFGSPGGIIYPGPCGY